MNKNISIAKILTVFFLLMQISCNGQNENTKEEGKAGEVLTFDYKSWSPDCNSNYYVYIDTFNTQFTFDTFFAMNSRLIKINRSEYNVVFIFPMSPFHPVCLDNQRDYSETEPIAQLRYINNEIQFKWLGFYNLKTKERVHLENPFTNRIETQPITLHKCGK